MFACELFMTANCPDGQMFCSRRIQLPFVPFVGLRIVDVSSTVEGEKVEEVTWRPIAGEFFVRLKGYDSKDGWSRRFVKEALGFGWDYRDGDGLEVRGK